MAKMWSLYKSRDDIYKARKVWFHWNIGDVLEAKFNIVGRSEGHADIEGGRKNLMNET